MLLDGIEKGSRHTGCEHKGMDGAVGDMQRTNGSIGGGMDTVNEDEPRLREGCEETLGATVCASAQHWTRTSGGGKHVTDNNITSDLLLLGGHDEVTFA